MGSIVYSGTHEECWASVKILPKDSERYLNHNLDKLKNNYEGKIVHFLRQRSRRPFRDIYEIVQLQASGLFFIQEKSRFSDTVQIPIALKKRSMVSSLIFKK